MYKNVQFCTDFVYILYTRKYVLYTSCIVKNLVFRVFCNGYMANTFHFVKSHDAVMSDWVSTGSDTTSFDSIFRCHCRWKEWKRKRCLWWVKMYAFCKHFVHTLYTMFFILYMFCIHFVYKMSTKLAYVSCFSSLRSFLLEYLWRYAIYEWRHCVGWLFSQHQRGSWHGQRYGTKARRFPPMIRHIVW